MVGSILRWLPNVDSLFWENRTAGCFDADVLSEFLYENAAEGDLIIVLI